MTWEIFETKDVSQALALRRAVFIQEQGISEAEEIDDLDGEAIHLLATVDGSPVGTARLLCRGDKGKIGRICVLSSHRGIGLGAALVEAGVAYFRTQPGVQIAALSSQDHAIPFYEKLGFQVYGETYLDADIPHTDMELKL